MIARTGLPSNPKELLRQLSAQEGAVGIETRFTDGAIWDPKPGRGKTFFFSSKRPARL